MRVWGWVVEALTLLAAMASNLLFTSMVASLAVAAVAAVFSSIFEYFKLLFLNPHGIGDAYLSNSVVETWNFCKRKGKRRHPFLFLSRVLTPEQVVIRVVLRVNEMSGAIYISRICCINSLSMEFLLSCSFFEHFSRFRGILSLNIN